MIINDRDIIFSYRHRCTFTFWPTVPVKLSQAILVWLSVSIKVATILLLTRQSEKGLKIAALGDARAVFSTRVPQVLILSVGDDDATRDRGHLPVVVCQRRSSDQPASYTQKKPGRFHSG